MTARRSARAAHAVAALAIILASRAHAQGIPRATPEQVGLSPAALGAIPPMLQRWVDSGRFAGVIAVVARHGKLAYVASAGSLDPVKHAAPTTDDVFRIFSMSKPITSVAIMQLVERGAIKLDDPVSKYIPAFKGATVYAGGGAAHPTANAAATPITISHLLTHTSGLTYGLFGSSTVDSIYMRASLGSPMWTVAQLSDSIAHLPLMFTPGTRWNYSYAIDVLGRVVEVASGQTFDRYLDSAIFKPLSMTSTAFHATPEMRARMTTLYAKGPDGKLHAAPQMFDASYMATSKMFSGGGGLLSTVSDYLRFAQMLNAGGELDGHRLLKRSTVDLMMQNHVAPSITPIKGLAGMIPGSNGFGYGGAVRLDSGGTMPGGRGTFRWGGYATTFFFIDRANDLIAMLWTQYAPVTEQFELDGVYQRVVYTALSGK